MTLDISNFPSPRIFIQGVSGKGPPFPRHCPTWSRLVSIYCGANVKANSFYWLQWGQHPLANVSGASGFCNFLQLADFPLLQSREHLTVELVGTICPALWPNTSSQGPVIIEIEQKTWKGGHFDLVVRARTLPI